MFIFNKESTYLGKRLSAIRKNTSSATSSIAAVDDVNSINVTLTTFTNKEFTSDDYSTTIVPTLSSTSDAVISTPKQEDLVFGLLKQIIRKQNIIQAILLQLVNDVNDLKTNENVEQKLVAVNNSIFLLFDFPLKDDEYFLQLEQYLEDEKQLNDTIQKLSRIGGHNGQDFVKRVMFKGTIQRVGQSVQLQTHVAGDEWQFSCHHGPYECQGNKIQACALKEIEEYTPTQKDAGYNPIAVAFINCLMDKTENTTDSTKTHQYLFPTKQCAEINHVENYADIENCSARTIGSKYLVDLGLQTRTFQDPIKSVPTIVFNNVYKEKDSQEATSNFVTVLCKYITKDKPMECSGCTRTPTVAMLILILTFIKFF
ncbi:hypothetical protein FQA39_LY18142 [Lamprigera yunnana]|nr:hypothetical protein FQA39_LY18142 [Lamprigera yunnana]